MERQLPVSPHSKTTDWTSHETPLDLAFESHGTQRFYAVFPYVFAALSLGSVVILDEIDNALHPLALSEVVRQFQNAELNPKNAQLIVSCQDATLLHDLVKEEVYFTEKNETGQTKLFGLSDIAGVRRDENIYAKYLAGVYGAIPRLG